MQSAGWSGQARRAVRPAAGTTSSPAPSWGRVLATTVGLWTSRRVSRLRRPLLLVVICALVLSAAAAGVVWLTGTSSRAARAASPQAPSQARPGAAAASPGPAGASGASAVARSVRSQAAAWVAGQVSGDETIACDPVMCAALRAHGVAAGRLLALGPAAAGASGAEMIVTSPPARPGLSRDAPALLASFGSGPGQVQVRAVSVGGAAAWQSAVQADLAARRSAGAQLLHSRRLAVSAQGTGQLTAGAVDTRLLIMLAMLASQHPWQVVAFGGASPGVPLAQAPFRQVIITSADQRALAAALALVRAQRAPYQPARAAIVRLAGGQPGLLIDFAAPGPLGLLAGGAAG